MYYFALGFVGGVWYSLFRRKSADVLCRLCQPEELKALAGLVRFTVMDVADEAGGEAGRNQSVPTRIA